MKFNEVLEQVIRTKTYKSVSKLPKEKGSNANILFHNSKELSRILKQCREKYETCNVFEQIGVVSLINRK